MNLYRIKRAVARLSNTDFFRFFNWFEKYGWERINKLWSWGGFASSPKRLARLPTIHNSETYQFTKSSRLRQAVLGLSKKELETFDDWLEVLWSERWNEEVENDPIARQCRELGNIIMNKFRQGTFIDDLKKMKYDSKDKK